VRSLSLEFIHSVMKHRYFKNRVTLSPVLIALLLPGLLPGANAAQLFKWVDEDGNVSYSDKLPPKQVRGASEILNEQGIVISRTEAAKTEEELAAARKIQEELEARLAAEKRAKEKQYAEDQVLLLTFSSEEEMDRVQFNRLDVLETVILLIKKSLSATEEKLAGLEKTALEVYTSKGREIPGGLAQNIEFFARKKEIREQQLELKETEKSKITRQYRIDLARYRYLKAIQVN